MAKICDRKHFNKGPAAKAQVEGGLRSGRVDPIGRQAHDWGGGISSHVLLGKIFLQLSCFLDFEEHCDG